jgi:hypothetical protein
MLSRDELGRTLSLRLLSLFKATHLKRAAGGEAPATRSDESSSTSSSARLIIPNAMTAPRQLSQWNLQNEH